MVKIWLRFSQKNFIEAFVNANRVFKISDIDDKIVLGAWELMKNDKDVACVV